MTNKHSMRIEYGKHIVRLAGRNRNIVALEADLKDSTQSVQFQEAYPDRYFEVGIAEQNMVGIAAGLALSGKIPIVHSFACFISMRACEQVRTSVAYPNLNVKFVVSHGGISTGTAGTTHHAIEDIAIMRAIPNMTVIAPGDAEEARQALEAALAHKGPVYIRLTAGDAFDVYSKKDKFAIGRANQLRKGKKATIISTGTLMHEAVQAADILKENYSIDVSVLQMACVKPIDEKAVLKAAKETRNLLTVEEHNIIGGLGSAVAEIASSAGCARIKRLGINDHFCGIGSAEYLMKQEGLTADNIVSQMKGMVGKK